MTTCSVVEALPQAAEPERRGRRRRSSFRVASDAETSSSERISLVCCNGRCHCRRHQSAAEHGLRAGECLRVRRPALHATEPGQAQKDLVVPPVAPGLRREALVQQLDLAVRHVGGERNVDRRAPEITVPLRDLVRQGRAGLERPSAPPRRSSGGPDGHRRHDGARIRSGAPRVRHVLEDVLHAIPDRGKPAFGQLVQVDGHVGAGKKAAAALRASA